MSNQNDTYTPGSERSKARQLLDFMEEFDIFKPAAEHVVGLCRECDSQVWICTNMRPFGMAESCEEHEPLCRYQDGGCRV